MSARSCLPGDPAGDEVVRITRSLAEERQSAVLVFAFGDGSSTRIEIARGPWGATVPHTVESVAAVLRDGTARGRRRWQSAYRLLREFDCGLRADFTVTASVGTLSDV